MRIGVFDSGMGGITVLLELRKKFPEQDFVYLGDTEHVPYGTKSPHQIEKLSVACAQILKKKKIDVLVIACNTASSWAFDAIQKTLGTIPVMGVVAPGVEAALSALSEIQNKKSVLTAPILILATRATVQSQAYGMTLRKILTPECVQGLIPLPIIEQACPLIVPMIEEGWIDHFILEQTVAEYVKPHVNSYGPGVALLGCTHYPWIHSVFEKVLPKWKVVNSAQSVAQALEASGWIPKSKKKKSSLQKLGHVEWIFTDPEAVPEFAKKWIY